MANRSTDDSARYEAHMRGLAALARTVGDNMPADHDGLRKHLGAPVVLDDEDGTEVPASVLRARAISAEGPQDLPPASGVIGEPEAPATRIRVQLTHRVNGDTVRKGDLGLGPETPTNFVVRGIAVLALLARLEEVRELFLRRHRRRCLEGRATDRGCPRTRIQITEYAEGSSAYVKRGSEGSGAPAARACNVSLPGATLAEASAFTDAAIGSLTGETKRTFAELMEFFRDATEDGARKPETGSAQAEAGWGSGTAPDFSPNTVKEQALTPEQVWDRAQKHGPSIGRPWDAEAHKGLWCAVEGGVTGPNTVRSASIHEHMVRPKAEEIAARGGEAAIVSPSGVWELVEDPEVADAREGHPGTVRSELLDRQWDAGIHGGWWCVTEGPWHVVLSVRHARPAAMADLRARAAEAPEGTRLSLIDPDNVLRASSRAGADPEPEPPKPPAPKPPAPKPPRTRGPEPLTKMEAYKALCGMGKDASFLANVVLTNSAHKGKRAARLKAIHALAAAGRDVVLAPFTVDRLLVDGRHLSWEDLDGGREPPKDPGPPSGGGEGPGSGEPLPPPSPTITARNTAAFGDFPSPPARGPLSLVDASALLASCERSELRDHAFGDTEVTWTDPEGTVVADGYFGGTASVVVAGTSFDGEDARALRDCGSLAAVGRNDETGPDEWREGEAMPGLTAEAVRAELEAEPPAAPKDPAASARVLVQPGADAVRAYEAMAEIFYGLSTTVSKDIMSLGSRIVEEGLGTPADLERMAVLARDGAEHCPTMADYAAAVFAGAVAGHEGCSFADVVEVAEMVGAEPEGEVRA